MRASMYSIQAHRAKVNYCILEDELSLEKQWGGVYV
jgi:hypothetical protein